MFSQPSDLVGEELAGVHFVRNYVELYFDGPVIRILGDFALNLNGQIVRTDDPGWRDALCGLIGARVEEIKIDDHHACTITLDGRRTIVISLVPTEKSGPETMHFLPGLNTPIAVW